MKKCRSVKMSLGCDPEIFLKKYGHVVGSETVLDKDTENVIRDGVQAELNPFPSACRTLMMGAIRTCFSELAVKADRKKVKVSNDVTVQVSQRHYKTLTEDSKQFGCMPSFNTHTDEVSLMQLDPAEYLYRSAGGHIHIGESMFDNKVNAVVHDSKKLVDVLDVIVGNTMVLLDRDDGNVERRKHYGQAGEYRKPKHGTEYRVLSNFWLRGTPLMSLAFGLVRHGVLLCEAGLRPQLLKLVDMEDIIKAINDNDKVLAQKNFDKIKQFLVDSAPCGGFFPLTTDTLEGFQSLVDDGIDKHFNKPIVDVWTKDMRCLGFNDFIRAEYPKK